jgi:hypothetical protein
MRPRGPHRTALAGFVSGGGAFTMAQIATNLGCSIKRANDLLRHAMDAGEVRVAGTTRVPGAKRPVAQYAGADVRTAEAPELLLAGAIRGWGR